jgi:hypothetical protein
MGQAHERHVCELMGFRPSPGSGNQDRAPLDGRHTAEGIHYRFGFDGKSTLRQSMSIGRDTWRKLCEQAHDLRPMLPIRFYDSGNLTVAQDLVVLDLNDLAELWQDAEAYQDLRNS